jgi:hypothetical protein
VFRGARCWCSRFGVGVRLIITTVDVEDVGENVDVAKFSGAGTGGAGIGTGLVR